jgi:phospholipid transport system transporter-binding protein
VATTASIEFSNGYLRVRGPLTLATVESLLKDASLRLDGSEIRVDLSGVTEADSSAVGLLLTWVRDGAASGRRVHFENLPTNLKSLVSLYDVGEFIPGA